MQEIIAFASVNTLYAYNGGLDTLSEAAQGRSAIFITDSKVHGLYASFFEGKDTIVVKEGEASKSLVSVEEIIGRLIAFEAGRDVLLIGVGGGVVTDITGFVAAVYLRGVSFGFMPTTLLAMVDAAIGGKNGVNTGLYKNMIGTVRQPEFILYDQSFLASLPNKAWCNGFAEVIKYACIFDTPLFEELERNDVVFYQNNADELSALIRRCAGWKNKTVVEDEHEKNIRKLLNFGHTAGHALENKYHLGHGAAVAIGMVIACGISEELAALGKEVKQRLKALLLRYGLPVGLDYNHNEVMEILKADKKRNAGGIDYILLTEIGHAVIQKVDFKTIAKHLANTNN